MSSTRGRMFSASLKVGIMTTTLFGFGSVMASSEDLPDFFEDPLGRDGGHAGHVRTRGLIAGRAGHGGEDWAPRP